MKAAYLAYDKNSLVGLSVLSNYFEQIDFYLVDQGVLASRIDFADVAIKTDHLLIPAEESLRTPTHLEVLKTLNEEFQFYKNELYLDYRKTSSTYTEIQKNCKTEISSLSLVKDIVFNNKTSEVFIEREKIGISSYQYIFVEDHQILAEEFGGFAKHIFSKHPKNSHVWLTTEFTYELKKPRTENLGGKKFILLKDRLNKSVLDNWYFVRTSENHITVQQWVPINQFKNSDYQRFIVERAEKILKEKLELIQIKQFNRVYVNSTSGFSTTYGKLKNNKISTLLPSFHFWSQETINRYLYTKLDAKMKELHRMQQLAAQAARGL